MNQIPIPSDMTGVPNFIKFQTIPGQATNRHRPGRKPYRFHSSKHQSRANPYYN